MNCSFSSEALLRLQRASPAGWTLWYRPIIKHLQHKMFGPFSTALLVVKGFNVIIERRVNRWVHESRSNDLLDAFI